MTKKQHLLLAIIFFALLAFEIFAFTSILNHPYMVGLCLLLGCVGGFNLGAALVSKK
jgi:hypothetical protein